MVLSQTSIIAIAGVFVPSVYTLISTIFSRG
jgi:hypothetical protein